MTLTDAERGHLVTLLDRCGELLSNQGCNDFPVPNTDENWAMRERMGAWNVGLTVEQWREHHDYDPRPMRKTLYLTDWFVLAYLAAKLKGGAT